MEASLHLCWACLMCHPCPAPAATTCSSHVEPCMLFRYLSIQGAVQTRGPHKGTCNSLAISRQHPSSKLHSDNLERYKSTPTSAPLSKRHHPPHHQAVSISGPFIPRLTTFTNTWPCTMAATLLAPTLIHALPTLHT